MSGAPSKAPLSTTTHGSRRCTRTRTGRRRFEWLSLPTSAGKEYLNKRQGWEVSAYHFVRETERICYLLKRPLDVGGGEQRQAEGDQRSDGLGAVGLGPLQ